MSVQFTDPGAFLLAPLALLLWRIWRGRGRMRSTSRRLISLWLRMLIFLLLLIALAGLIYGRYIFKGPAVHPKFQMVSYAYLTMIVILAPAVLDGLGSSGAGGAFWSRLLLFLLIAVYGTLAVWAFDALFPGKGASPEPVGARPA